MDGVQVTFGASLNKKGTAKRDEIILWAIP
jgi:hypothetical protein